MSNDGGGSELGGALTFSRLVLGYKCGLWLRLERSCKPVEELGALLLIL